MNQTIQAFGKKYTFNSKGAELVSAIDSASGYEFIWQADAAVWARHAPILFPIVGKLKNNSYQLNGKKFELPQHGFARDESFEIQEIYTDLITFKLVNNTKTESVYPFQFSLMVSYRAIELGIEMVVSIQNKGQDPMPFSFGLHPGFQLPEANLNAFELFSDYPLKWERSEIQAGLLTGKKQIVSELSENIRLDTNIFKDDALVFEHFLSKTIGLKHLNSNYEVKMVSDGFNYLGIWNKFPSQNFVCIEPWAGITDNTGAIGDLYQKKGIQIIKCQEIKEFTTLITLKAPN